MRHGKVAGDHVVRRAIDVERYTLLEWTLPRRLGGIRSNTSSTRHCSMVKSSNQLAGHPHHAAEQQVDAPRAAVVAITGNAAATTP